MLPLDIVGGFIFNMKSREFEFRRGPVFTDILLADEINRAPPKVQSALLEAMQERQGSLGGSIQTRSPAITGLGEMKPRRPIGPPRQPRWQRPPRIRKAAGGLFHIVDRQRR